MRVPGRKPTPIDEVTKTQMREVLDERGPGIGLPTLQADFPAVARRAAAALLLDYRREHVAGREVEVVELDWREVGTVWAMDYATPPAKIDGCYPAFLAVRDLASRLALIALPVLEPTAESTARALRMLFAEHGAPLVLKSDNGGHFTAPAVAELLAEAGVAHLRSPVRRPSYNGSIEAGIGAIKVRAHHEAARRGRPGEWTCDDLFAAIEAANTTGRPRGAAGPTPLESWRARRPIGDERRQALLAELPRLQDAVRCEWHVAPAAGDAGEDTNASVRREAISRALEAHGLLVVRRKRIRLPIPNALRARVS